VRAAAVAACCTTTAFLLPDGTSSWVSRLILLLELAAGLGCQQLARRQITAAKRAEQWFAGRRQVVVADTGWRADPPAWLSTTGGRLTSKSPASAFAPVIGMGRLDPQPRQPCRLARHRRAHRRPGRNRGNSHGTRQRSRLTTIHQHKPL
jgi:hypothetical protein